MRKVTGTREQITLQLEQLAEGSEHLEAERLRAEACAALDQVRQGATLATAGHTVYEIADATSQPVPPDVQSAKS